MLPHLSSLGDLNGDRSSSGSQDLQRSRKEVRPTQVTGILRMKVKGCTKRVCSSTSKRDPQAPNTS